MYYCTEGAERFTGEGVGNHRGWLAYGDLGDIGFVDIYLGAHVGGIGELNDIGGATAGLDIAAVVNRVAKLAIFMEHDSVDRPSDHTLTDVETRVIDRALRPLGFRLAHRPTLFSHLLLLPP